MPRLSGEGLFAATRGNPSTAHIPFIFLSAQAGIEARAHALERGVDDYLVSLFLFLCLLYMLTYRVLVGQTIPVSRTVSKGSHTAAAR